MLFAASILSAQSPVSTAGTASNLLLRFDFSPRVAAMSGSFTALADDESALMYNPGGLPTLNKGMVSLNHTVWFEDIQIDNISAAYPVTRELSVGAAFTYMWMPGIEGKDALGRDTGTLNVASYVSYLGVGYKWFSGFQTGVSARYFSDDLAGYTASGVAFDAGIHTNAFLPGLSVGIAVQNLGGKIKYDKSEQEIPRVYRAGVAYRLYNPNILLTTDVVKSIDTDYNVHFGGEYIIANQFLIRIGNKFASNEMLSPSFGAGFIFQQHFMINYTFSTFTDLGSAHRLGFAYHFNTPATKKVYSSLAPISGPAILIPPRNVKVAVTDTRLTISWNAVKGATYNVYARHSSTMTWNRLNEKPLYLSSMKFKRPITTGNYSFRVSAIIAGKESPFSEEVKIDIK
jgi:hypothetical protein